MHKIFWLIILAVVIVALATYFILANPERSLAPSPISTSTVTSAFDPLRATYTIENQQVTLVNGKAEASNPGSATVMTTTVFGQPANGDLNGDGIPDAAVFLVQNDGGSGTFYYVAAAINASGGTEGTNAILLGDRIVPQNITIQNGQIIANYADRKPSEPFSTAPSVGVTKYISYIGSTLQESAPVAGPGEHCGGNMLNAPTCQTNYHCAPAVGSHLPFGDVGGTCVAN